MVEPLMSHGLLYRYPCYVSGPGTISVVLLSRVRALSDFIKNILICVPKMDKGLTGNDMRVSN